MNKTNVIAVVVIVGIVGVAAFFSGMKYGRKDQPAGNRQIMANFQGRQFGNGGMQAARGRGASGGGFVNGEIIKKDDTSVTVKLPDGGSKIIFINASSSVLKSTAGSAADLEAGKAVSINGTANSDGSMTAQMIQLRDRPFGAPGERNPSGAASSTGQAK
jgi:hypothetical protein